MRRTVGQLVIISIKKTLFSCEHDIRSVTVYSDSHISDLTSLSLGILPMLQDRSVIAWAYPRTEKVENFPHQHF